MSTGVHVEKDGKRPKIGPGYIIVFVKNASDGSRRSNQEVKLQFTYPTGVVENLSATTDLYGIAVFDLASLNYIGSYLVSINIFSMQVGYFKHNNDDGYHTFLTL